MKKIIFLFFIPLIVWANPPIYIAFHWHMHQPIYWPYETVIETDQNHRYDYSVVDIHNQRTGPYTAWPMDAIQKAIDAGLPHGGAHISFSGSLIENLNALEQAGNENFVGWKNSWNAFSSKTTSLGNQRIEFTAFGYHHPLMGLIPQEDIVRQIEAHRNSVQQELGYRPSKGLFPPENAFRNEMIPALVKSGISWVLVDNIHFERACKNYPYSIEGNLYEPNPAYQLNPDPGDWIHLNNLWAPTYVSALWSRQPHYVQYIDPETGEKTKLIAVPADRYLGNEDGRGGFGALDYESVMSQLEPYNTDPNHPMLIILAHDGDNYGGGSESYYHNNFDNFISWIQENSHRFQFTTIQDYLDQFPPDENDIIEVENGSWSGADNGDPEFKKWLGDPYNGYSPDWNSWAVVTAGQNAIYTADAENSESQTIQEAWKYLMNAQTSCYWYWDGSQDGRWDSHPTRAINQAYELIAPLLTMEENVSPTIFYPQREPFNPGGFEWMHSQTHRDTIWTFVYDISGLCKENNQDNVFLKYRFDKDGMNDPNTDDNERYDGGSDVTPWQTIVMNSFEFPSQTDPLPVIKAPLYKAVLPDTTNVLIDYYIEAEDIFSNVAKSVIQHVWIGSHQGTLPGSGESLTWIPSEPTKNDTITLIHVTSKPSPVLHWGINGWQTPPESLYPPYTVTTTGSAVETPFLTTSQPDSFILTLGPLNKAEGYFFSTIDFVIRYSDNTWNNNNGNDFHISILDTGNVDDTFVLDGQPEPWLTPIYHDNNLMLYVHVQNNTLYLGTTPAPSVGKDVFLFLAHPKSTLINMPWAKAGMAMEWDAYLAQESTNGWNGWTPGGIGAQSISADILEATIPLDPFLTHEEDTLLLVLVHIETNDGGSMVFQYPSGNGDINLDPDEWINIFTLEIHNSLKRTNIETFELTAVYPNPFNPVTTLHVITPSVEHAQLFIYNLKGQHIATLHNGSLTSGKYSFTWDASSYASGIYFALFKNSKTGHVSIKKLTLLK
ncbi:MAG: T9SS type A sorting domain-containing protein [Candidatus Marinimicrobia bacterium]|nr:T9SS type A sorting domain-containing protein [Candidatus Neomarinimicrobiota bacterium]